MVNRVVGKRYRDRGKNYRERLLTLPRDMTNSEAQCLFHNVYDFADYLADIHAAILDTLQSQGQDHQSLPEDQQS